MNARGKFLSTCALGFILSGFPILVKAGDDPKDIQLFHQDLFLQLFLHYNMADELDTFHGIYQKDLIPGTVRTEMYLTPNEQEVILTALERYHFFSLPDTLHSSPNVKRFPDFGAQVLRVKTKDIDKTVVWFYPIDRKYKADVYVEHIISLIQDIVYAKPEYKALPPTKGGYQ